MDYLGVILLGGLFGFVELIGRYRDNPWGAAFSLPGGVYMAINASASATALLLFEVFEWDIIVTETGEQTANGRIVQVLLAGLAGMALFRSSLLSFRVGGQDMNAGLHVILQILLSVTDEQVNRRRGIDRNQVVSQIGSNVSFAKAGEALPAYCFTLLPYPPDEDTQRRFAAQVAELGEMNLSDRTKGRMLVLSLLNLCGDQVVEEAVETLGAEIGIDAPD